MCFFVNFNLYDVLFKIVVNVIVVILNYILSKLIVFKNNRDPTISLDFYFRVYNENY